MNKRFTRAANAAGKKTLPNPKRLQFSTPSSSGSNNATPKSASKKKNKEKRRTPAKNSTNSTQQTSPINSAPTEIEKSSTTTENLTMASVRVQFPPFKTDDIEAWFRRVEHWFTFSKVTTETDKFALIASQIENSTVANLDEMLNPKMDETPYYDLKKKIISIFEATTTAKINNLLSGCKLGDLKPSQLLSEMKRLGGNVGDDILRNLWSKRLPLHVQTVVAAATKLSMDEVAVVADTVIDVVGTPASIVNQVTGNNIQQPLHQEIQSTKTSEIEDLRAAVNQLTKSFRDMQSNRSRSKSRDNQNTRDHSSTYKPPENRICRYHRKFGEKAWLCTKPCSFVPDGESKN